jgi:hypothetical protein
VAELLFASAKMSFSFHRLFLLLFFVVAALWLLAAVAEFIIPNTDPNFRPGTLFGSVYFVLVFPLSVLVLVTGLPGWKSKTKSQKWLTAAPILGSTLALLLFIILIEVCLHLGVLQHIVPS